MALGSVAGPAFSRAVAAQTLPQTLVAKPGVGEVMRGDVPLKVPFWGYNDHTPGPVLSVDQGAGLDLVLKNGLPQSTTVHWHGIRTPNEMDGVPYVTQKAVGKGESFAYRFRCEDAGTFWYHPHANSAEQIGRGLYGALIVREEKPLQVDREIVWVLSDLLIGKDGVVSEKFNSLGLNSHAGRLGNLVTVNGRHRPEVDVQPGERLRLRLINAAAARIFSFDFTGLSGWWVAQDGQPVQPRPIDGEAVFIPPGGRADVVLDVPSSLARDRKYEVFDATYRNRRFVVAAFRPAGKVLRTTSLAMPQKIADNPLARPKLDGAGLKTVLFEGGAMGGMRSATLDGRKMAMTELVENGILWANNGKAWSSLAEIARRGRLFNLDLGKSYVLRLQNKTAFVHPIHLHGHTFQVIAVAGKRMVNPPWRDTVLVFPNEHVDIAFVADNPGDWLLHCHILGHAMTGMMAAYRVG